MPDTPESDEKKKVEGWNIRPFDRDLRIACQIQARKEDMYDYEWVQKKLREALAALAFDTARRDDSSEDSATTPIPSTKH